MLEDIISSAKDFEMSPNFEANDSVGMPSKTETVLEHPAPEKEEKLFQRPNGSNGVSITTAKVEETADPEYKREIVWKNVAKFIFLHAIWLYGFFCVTSAKWQTLAFSFLCYFIGNMGVTAGAHRLWTHRSYKAKAPLRAFLAFANLMAVEDSIFVWARDHRVHHKYSETNADPHNATRGFFFSHIGWLMVRKHPDVIRSGKKLDLSDLKNDPILMFQHRHYPFLAMGVSFFLPTVIPWAMWGEGLWLAYVMAIFRYVWILNNTWLVNSVAHLWGERPYDKNISPAENPMVCLLSGGEGFHNYHHTFPQDYSTSEWRYSLNLTTFFIDCMAAIGQAYDRKSIDPHTVNMRMLRTGDGRGKQD